MWKSRIKDDGSARDKCLGDSKTAEGTWGTIDGEKNEYCSECVPARSCYGRGPL